MPENVLSTFLDLTEAMPPDEVHAIAYRGTILAMADIVIAGRAELEDPRSEREPPSQREGLADG